MNLIGARIALSATAVTKASLAGSGRLAVRTSCIIQLFLRLGMGDFDGMLELQIPRLRRYARALTRDFSQSRSTKLLNLRNRL